MDAYTDYILRASHDRLRELRREAAEHATSRATRQRRNPWWIRLLRRRPAAHRGRPTPAPVRCPVCQTPLALTVGQLAADELVGASP